MATYTNIFITAVSYNMATMVLTLLNTNCFHLEQISEPDMTACDVSVYKKAVAFHYHRGTYNSMKTGY